MAKARILIVDDEEIVAKSTAFNLKKMGYEIAGIAFSGQAAIDLAVKVKLDVIVMDIRLTDEMDGIEAVHEIQKIINVPIIYLAEFADNNTLSRAMATKPHGYLIKPFNLEELVSNIEISIHNKLLENKLMESEKKYRLLIENQSELVVKVDLENRFEFVSKSYLDLFGKTEDELLGNTFIPLIHEDDREITAFEMKKLFHPPYSCYIEQRALTKYGWRWLSWNDKAILDENGKMISILGIGKDISEIKETAEELAKSEEYNKNLLESTQIAIVSLNSDLNIIYENPAIKKLFGIKKEANSKFFGENFFDPGPFYFSDPEYIKQKLLNGEFISNLVVEYKSVSNDNLILDMNIAPIFYENSFDGAIVTAKDITEKIVAEKELENSKRELSTLISNIPGIAFRCSNDKYWTMHFISDGCYNLTGYYPEDIINNKRLSYAQIIHPDDQAFIYREVETSLQQHSQYQIEYRIITAQNEIKWVWEQGVGVFDESDDLKFLEGMITDVTERVEAENNVRKSRLQLRKLNTHLQEVRENERKKIALDIHDDLGQSLTALKFDASFLSNNYKGSDKSFEESLHSMITLIDGTIETVQRISAELRPSLLDDIGLEAAISWLTDDIKKRTKLDFQISIKPNPQYQSELATNIYRIVQESLTNVTRHSGATKVWIDIFEVDDEIHLIIKDNGRGIHPEEIKNINSLGLLGMEERATSMKGKFKISGEKNKGTRIIVVFPKL